MSGIGKNYLYYLVAIGFLVRLIIFIVFYTHITIFPDSSGYITLAERIADFDISGYSGSRSPGYPLLITLGFGNLYLVVFYQFLLGILTSTFWYKSMLKLKFSEKFSFGISVFLTTLLNVIFFETAILVESFVLFLISLLIYRILKFYNKTTKYKTEIITGILLGFLTLVKPFYAFLPFLIYLLFTLKDFKIKKIINKKLILLIFPLIAYFGWSYVNKINTGYFVSTTFLGLNISQNCVYFAEKGPDKYDWISEPYVKYREKSLKENKDVAMSIWYAYNEGEYEKYNLNFNDFSQALGEYAKETIKQNPQDYLYQVFFYSWKDFWKPGIHWNYYKFNFNYANKILLVIWYIQNVVLWFFRLSFVMLIPFFLIKAIWNRKITAEFILFMTVFSASILQALVTYGTNSRFSFPFEFIMIFLVMIYIKNRSYLIKHKKF